MDKLVVDHSYALGIAWDRTEYRNHGLLYQTPPGSGFFQSSLSFAPGRTAPGSMVVVPPAKSFAEIGAVRARARIYTTALGGGARRQNVIEGHLSFALFVNPDLSVQATFLDSTGNWTGIRSGVRAVVPNQWFNIEYWYDGISAAEILINGTRVASAFNPVSHVGAPMRGPVRGIGPRGIAIGHWPEPDDRYTFNGYVRDVQVYKRDDLEDLLKLLDKCCLRDLSQWYDLGNRLRKDGYNLAYARRIKDQLVALGSETMADLRGGSEQATEQLNALLQQFLWALSRRGSVPLGPSLMPLLTWMATRASPQQAADVEARARALLSDLPLKEDELLDIVNRLCFTKLRETVETEGKKTESDPQWKRIREKFRR